MKHQCEAMDRAERLEREITVYGDRLDAAIERAHRAEDDAMRLERQRDNAIAGWKAANAQIEMLRQVIDDKYPAPPNYYLRALGTQLHEALVKLDQRPQELIPTHAPNCLKIAPNKMGGRKLVPPPCSCGFETVEEECPHCGSTVCYVAELPVGVDSTSTSPATVRCGNTGQIIP